MRVVLLSIVLLGFTTLAQATDTAQGDSPTAMAAMGSSGGWVARAVVTTGIEQREPIDKISSLATDNTRVYYFTDVRDLAGRTVTHRWEYNGEIMAEIQFDIGGERWRVFSSKTLMPSWSGDWKVSVVDADGNPLSVNTFVYGLRAARAIQD
ncbi:MAG: DUF2914 domain-containing protein [Acidiferrobacterales bacterium]